MDISKRLKELRRKKAITQKTVAVNINISERAYIDLENNKYLPAFETLIALAQFFDVSIDWLMRGIDYGDAIGGGSYAAEITEVISMLSEENQNNVAQYAEFLLSKEGKSRHIEAMLNDDDSEGRAANPDSHKGQE